MKGYASIAAALTNLLKKDGFEWNEEATKAFTVLKEAMTTTHVLKLPDFDKNFVIEADVSGLAIGAVLIHEGHPICFYSNKLGSKMQMAATYIKELYAIVEVISKWRQYLFGQTFVVRTDQKSIKELLQQTIHTPEQQKYMRKLLGFDFKIEYKPRQSNLAADALSRMFEVKTECNRENPHLMLLNRPIPKFLEMLKEENQSLEELIELHEQFRRGQLSSEYKVVNNLLLYKGRYFFGQNSALKEGLLREFHATITAGHGGIKKTLMRLSNNFYWKNMRKDVEAYVARCEICQRAKYSTQAPGGLFQPMLIPNMVWNELTIDFIVQLPSSHGFTVIFMVVDRLTKSAYFGALPTHYMAEKVETHFANMVVNYMDFHPL